MAAFVVAVTGGIASGKSLVDQSFAALGLTVVDADLIAREIVEPGEPALTEIVEAFGSKMLQANGSLDRVALRRRIFENADARHALEKITHPRIRLLLESRCRAAPGPYVIVSIPLLAEAGSREAYRWLDRIVVVDAATGLQRERLVRRDGIDPTLAERMILAQASRAERLALASDVIVNDAGVDGILGPVKALHDRFLHLATVASTY